MGGSLTQDTRQLYLALCVCLQHIGGQHTDGGLSCCLQSKHLELLSGIEIVVRHGLIGDAVHITCSHHLCKRRLCTFRSLVVSVRLGLLLLLGVFRHGGCLSVAGSNLCIGGCISLLNEHVQFFVRLWYGVGDNAWHFCHSIAHLRQLLRSIPYVIVP